MDEMPPERGDGLVPDLRWVDNPERWAALSERLLAAGEAGIDSETYNQPTKTSPQHRTKVHCWSIAVLGTSHSPRGYRRGVGLALPRAALDYPPLADALRSITLWAHNAPHDAHSFANEGFDFTINDTLQWARVASPGMGDYALKTKGMKQGIEQWALGKPMRKGFKEITSYEAWELSVNRSTRKRCKCGSTPCRKKETSSWFNEETGWFEYHERETVVVETPVEKLVKKQYAVTEFVPGHPLWKEWLDYVIVDAVSGIELVDWLRNLHQPKLVYPWRPNAGNSALATT